MAETVLVTDVVKLLSKRRWVQQRLSVFGSTLGIAESKTIVTDALASGDSTTALSELISFWVSSNPQTATVGRLIQKLKGIGEAWAAELLEKGFSRNSFILSDPVSPPIVLNKYEERAPIILGSEGSIAYYEDQLIGKGATANVFKGYFEDKRRKAAVKVMNGDHTTVHLNEIQILREADFHPNIVRYYANDTREVGNRTMHYIAMELARKTLEDFVTDKKYRCGIQRDGLKYWKDACEGLDWLHSKNILHRDIKPSNVLIFGIADEWDEALGFGGTAKLGDFGISRKVSSIIEGTDSEGKGTLDWMAPEALEALDDGPIKTKFKTTQGVDIFSLGLSMFWTFSVGQHPFGSVVKRYSNIVSKDYVPNLELLSTAAGVYSFPLIAVLSLMLSKQVSRRPPASFVLRHPVFWTHGQELEYIRCLSSTGSLCITNPHGQNFKDRQLIDKEFVKLRDGLFNWKDKMCSILRNYINSPGQKKYKYDENSVIDLVRYIRDKWEHRTYWPVELKEPNIFGDGVDLYMNYFTSRFPDFITYLFMLFNVDKEKTNGILT